MWKKDLLVTLTYGWQFVSRGHSIPEHLIFELTLYTFQTVYRNLGFLANIYPAPRTSFLLVVKMENWSTPVASRSRKLVNEAVRIPESPAMSAIGWGTGVNVYSFERSPKLGVYRSPWAVKKVNRKVVNAPESDYEMRLIDEAEILRSLNHPNIVGFRAFVVSGDGRRCLAMEECEASLGELIETRKEDRLGPFAANVIFKVGRDVASALQYLHTEHHLLHGDLKSFNILIKGDFEIAKLCDFGVCIRLNNEGVALPGQEYVGTECWLAPEALSGEEADVTVKVDIFAFGLVLWEMIALSVPHMEEDVDPDASFDEEKFNAKLGTRPALPDDLGDEYSPVLQIFMQCTKPVASERPIAGILLQHLNTLVAGILEK